MHQIRIGLKYKNKKFFLNVKRCGYFEEVFGLMFQRKENAEALLFDFSKRKRLALHSFFVFFPFLAIWLDDKNKIIDFRVVKPFSFNIFFKKYFVKIVEIPINHRYLKIIKKLVGSRKI